MRNTHKTALHGFFFFMLLQREQLTIYTVYFFSRFLSISAPETSVLGFRHPAFSLIPITHAHSTT